MKFSAAVFATLFVFAGCALAGSMTDSKKGILHIEVEIKGRGAHKGPTTFENASISRNLKLDIPMENVGRSFQDNARVIGDPDGDAGKQGANKTQDALAKAMEACGVDDACRTRIGMQISSRMMSGAVSAPNLGNSNRYVNWSTNAGNTCLNGTATLNDKGSGKSMGEAEGSFNYSYTLTGQTKYSNPKPAFDCTAALTLDTKTKLFSIRFSGLSVPITGRFNGTIWAKGNHEPTRSTRLVDKPKTGLAAADQLMIVNIPASSLMQASGGKSKDAAQFGGAQFFDKVGTVAFSSTTYNASAAVSANVIWTFTAE